MNSSSTSPSPTKLEAAHEELTRRTSLKVRRFFPDDGPLRRELYPRHLEFFSAAARFKERLFMAANRVGKSEAGAYEVTCHLTGEYPSWWTGRRFSEPVEVWAGPPRQNVMARRSGLESRRRLVPKSTVKCGFRTG
jgi:hypothetical protein